MKNTVKLNKTHIQQIKSILHSLPATHWCECLQKLCNKMNLCQASKDQLDIILEEMRNTVNV